MTSLRQVAELEMIGKIADRAVALYSKHDIKAKRRDVLMDITMAHFQACYLRLDELLATDDFNFIHDIAGINRHLDRVTGKLADCFRPRFAR